MLHNRSKQKFTETSSLLGDKVTTDLDGKTIDDCHLRVNRRYCYNILASNTASFSIDRRRCLDSNSKIITIVVLLLIAAVYTSTVLTWNGRRF